MTKPYKLKTLINALSHDFIFKKLSPLDHLTYNTKITQAADFKAGGAGPTAKRVWLAQVRRSGRLDRQLRHRHLRRHGVTGPQAAHAAAVLSVGAHLLNGDQVRNGSLSIY